MRHQPARAPFCGQSSGEPNEATKRGSEYPDIVKNLPVEAGGASLPAPATRRVALSRKCARARASLSACAFSGAPGGRRASVRWPPPPTAQQEGPAGHSASFRATVAASSWPFKGRKLVALLAALLAVPGVGGGNPVSLSPPAPPRREGAR